MRLQETAHSAKSVDSLTTALQTCYLSMACPGEEPEYKSKKQTKTKTSCADKSLFAVVCKSKSL